MEQDGPKTSYLPFAIASSVSILFFAFSDLYLLGILPMKDHASDFYYVPMLNLFLMAAVVWSSLRITFEIPVILALILAVLLFSPNVFIIIFALEGPTTPIF